MSQPADVARLKQQIAAIEPAIRTPLDGPYGITNGFFRTLMQIDHDVGGEPTVPVQYQEKEELDWELNVYVT